jgi:hypothetical protein
MTKFFSEYFLDDPFLRHMYDSSPSDRLHLREHCFERIKDWIRDRRSEMPDSDHSLGRQAEAAPTQSEIKLRISSGGRRLYL